METKTLNQNQKCGKVDVRNLTLTPAILWRLQGLVTLAEQTRLRKALATRAAESLAALIRHANPSEKRQCELAAELSRDVKSPQASLLTFVDLETLLGHVTLPQLPLVVSYAGNPEVLRAPRVAMIGSRHPTFYGRMQAQRFARELALAGVTIVSGGAIGIDTVSNATALEFGRSVAILGSGLGKPYPPSNEGLFGRLQSSGRGLVLSEFPEDQRADRWTFPRRNLTIAALADFVLVVEAAENSGCRHTVEAALDLGIDVGALPGPIDSPASQGTNAMIRDGAFPILSPEEILVRLATRLRPARRQGTSAHS